MARHRTSLIPLHADAKAPNPLRPGHRPSRPGPGWILGALKLACGLACLCPAILAQSLPWQQGQNFRFAPLTVPPSAGPGFTLMPEAQTGIQFTNVLSLENARTNNNLLNGAGLALGDIDQDGWCDIFLCNLGGPSALYRNLGGWKFQDATLQAGVACEGQFSTGALFADFNGDGSLDLMVTACGGPNAFFLNDGRGQFTNRTAAAGLLSKTGATSMAVADVDGDGDLDLYVVNYAALSVLRSGEPVKLRVVNGQTVVTGPYRDRIKLVDGALVELGEPDVLYLNDGQARFTPVPWTGGRFRDEEGLPLQSSPQDLGLSAMFRDLNGDTFPDLYVCNDFETPDRIWLNDGKGNFRALDRLAIRSTSSFSMGIDFADLDRDGFDDFIVCDMLSAHHHLRMTQTGQAKIAPAFNAGISNRPQIRRNTLFTNRGDGTFAELAQYAGVEASDWTWCPLFLDVDLDGFEDLLIANGHAYDTQDMDTSDRILALGLKQISETRKTLSLYPPLLTPNVAFRNTGRLTFAETGPAWGFNSTQITHGLATADLDQDGDLDLVANCLNAPPLVYRNDSPAPRLAVRLKGPTGNPEGIGARLQVLGGAVPAQSQEVISGGRYLSSGDPVRVFAAGNLTNPLTLLVKWRDGLESRLTGVTGNRVYEINHAGARPAAPAPLRTNPTPLFEDVSERLGDFRHFDQPFDDLSRQPLLPKFLSHAGPSAAWADLDGDGRDELVLTSGQGGRPGVFHNNGAGRFTPWTDRAWSDPVAHDQVAALAVSISKTSTALLFANSNYEAPLGKTPALSTLRFDGKTITQPRALIAAESSIGPLVTADFDGDGDLDLFAGGRAIPGRYPMAGNSFLFRNDSGTWVPDDRNQGVIERSGLVNGAVASDLNGDGFPELVLACEWGPIRVFLNDKGLLHDATVPYGLASFNGWWTGVAAGDFDGDGRMDLAASNWGLNSPYQSAASPRPSSARLYYGDFTGTGAIDLIEAEPGSQPGRFVPRQSMAVLVDGLPFLKTRFPSHRAFSAASLDEILAGIDPSKVHFLEASELSSMIFLNRGATFLPRALPMEAQLTPAFGVTVADFNGDGAEDLFLSQNFFATANGYPRYDSGLGLCLLGNGEGTFRALSGADSGIRIHGEQRAAATADFDEDGRADLVVTQNGAGPKLFRNAGSRPGWRVRFSGPAGNPRGIGAQIRLEFDQHQGPAREVHAGSGYASQDSPIVVLAGEQPPTGLSVSWPGGRISRAKWPSGAREVLVPFEGEVQAVK